MIERVGQQHHRPAVNPLAADCRQRGIKKALPRAVDRMDFSRRVDFSREPISPFDPGRDGSAQVIRSADLRVARQQVPDLGHLVDHKTGHRLVRITRGHLDDLVTAGRNAVEQPGNACERR